MEIAMTAMDLDRKTRRQLWDQIEHAINSTEFNTTTDAERKELKSLLLEFESVAFERGIG